MKYRLLTGVFFSLFLFFLKSDSFAISIPSLTPYSMQMHLHGPFSEGISTIDSQTQQAISNNVDVLWWTEHDFSLLNIKKLPNDPNIYEQMDFHISTSPSLRLPPVYNLSGNEVPVWLNSVKNPNTGADEITGYQYFEVKVNDDIQPINPTSQKNFFIGGIARNDSSLFKPIYYGLYPGGNNWNLTKTALAAKPRLQLDLKPTSENFINPQYACRGLDENGKITVRLTLSYHPEKTNPTISAGKYILAYEMTNSSFVPYLEDRTAYIPIIYQNENIWHHLDRSIYDDVVRFFPFIKAEDNSIVGIELGIEAKNNSAVCARFDDLQISAESGQQLLDRQNELLNYYTQLYPQVKQYQAIEYSGGGAGKPHIHGYGLQKLPGEIIDPYYNNYLETNFRNYFNTSEEIKNIVSYIHNHNGLASSTHMFGTTWWDNCSLINPLEKAREYYANDVYDTDLLEVGLRKRGRSLNDFLDVWDTLSANQIFITGIASNDDHGGPPNTQGLCTANPHILANSGGFTSYFYNQQITPWVNSSNNFVTKVYAQSKEEENLLTSLKKGSVFMADLGRFNNGTIEITTDEAQMGNVVIGHFEQKKAYYKITGLLPGDKINIIKININPNPPADPAEINLVNSQFKNITTLTAKTENIENAIDLDNNTLLRIEVCTQNGCDNVDNIKALSNPMFFLETQPKKPTLSEKIVLVQDCPNQALGNLDCDPQGFINQSDLNIMLNNFQTIKPVIINPQISPVFQKRVSNPSDLNNDNVINEIDLMILLKNWATE